MKWKSPVFPRAIMTALTVLAVGAIFYNSSLSAVESTEQSSPVTQMLNSILQSLHIPVTLTETVVRKLAHFTEYAILGALLATTVYLYAHTRLKTAAVTLIVGAIIPVCDESIQLFPAGRSCQVRDMVIDYTGVVFATLIALWIISIKEKRCKKRKEKP